MDEKIAEAMKVLQDAAERAVNDGFFGTIYGQPYNDGMQIIHIEPNEAQLDGIGLYYVWGWPGPDFNRYYLYDYGRTWALTEEEITGSRLNNG